ncbi:LysR substrate-binding domain-containing protein [Photobacterium minamisatsumaniensis]|uniref:LysR substrate-binding domain-containing protein n=1 Tax=Photobacterium minamisatsumaniensis TaxID=2910233 RepID=UPI003D0E8DB4
MERKQQLLANMHSFSVVARHLSFTKAAVELHLTQGAVSHRIKNLEKQLGFPLFVRLTRRMELTPEGERLLMTLNQSFENIFNELDDIRSNELTGELYIGTSPSFAASWLMPKLDRFQQLYPNLNIRIEVKGYRGEFKNEPLDAAIFYSRGNYVDSYSYRLFDERRLPTCSPEYAKKFGLLDGSVEALRDVNFIHGELSLIWQQWLDHSGVELNCTQRKYTFNQYELEIAAARQSMGVAMGRLRFVLPFLSSGELVAPFKAINTGLGYDLVCSEGSQHRPKFQAFSRWLESEIEQERRYNLDNIHNF